ncbi:MAG: hypothetical protein JWO30_290 [Fibrobacteres bacterium]|nr:hypothetical protein [Fibrobacterota bacterium]
MRKVILPLLTAFISGFAGIPVDINGNVSAMIKDYANGVGYTHKSGLKSGVVSYPSTNHGIECPNELNTASAITEWNGKKFKPFLLVHDSALYGTMAKVFKKKVLSLSNIGEKISDEEMLIQDGRKDSLSYFIAAPGDPGFDFLKNFAYYKGIAEQAVSDMSSALEYDNYEITLQDGAQTRLDIRFRRIFRGGIVRGNASFLYVGLEQDGRIYKIRAKWPEFIEDGSAERAYAQRPRRTVNEILSEARSRVENIPDISNNSESIFHPQKGIIESMALAWIPQEESGRMIIKPGFSFISKVDYEGGVVMNPYQDVSFNK